MTLNRSGHYPEHQDSLSEKGQILGPLRLAWIWQLLVPWWDWDEGSMLFLGRNRATLEPASVWVVAAYNNGLGGVSGERVADRMRESNTMSEHVLGLSGRNIVE